MNNLSPTILTVILSPTAHLRKGLCKILCPPAFDIIVSEESPSELSSDDIPRSDVYLLLIECAQSAQTVIREIALIRQWNILARVMLLGGHYQPNEIAAAFQAGANAYFAEAAISEEFLGAIQLITSSRTSFGYC